MATKFFKRVTNKENMQERGNKGQYLEGNKDPPPPLGGLFLFRHTENLSVDMLYQNAISTLIHDIQCKMLHQSLSLSLQNT